MSLKNPRITPKERGLIKGAIRRAFSRSELHKAALERVATEYHDPKRPRVKHWVWCECCGEVIPRWTASVDHMEPVIPVTTTFEDMSVDTVINRLWCELSYLQVLCYLCHDVKSSLENSQRPKRARKAKST